MVRLRLEVWQRNLVIMWFAQFITVVGFSFVFPFVPLFIQDELDVSNPGRAALWSGIAGSGMGFSLFLTGPIWGILGDRFGRKKNVMRALYGSAVTMSLTGLVANVYQLTALRFMTGMVSGVFAPSLALVASGTPKERVGFATGVLQSAMFLGSTLGPLFGGFVAELVGFRVSFFVTGSLLALAGTVVAVFVHEDFHREERVSGAGRRSPLRDMASLAFSPSLLPVLLLIYLVQVAPTLMGPVLPVFVRELEPQLSASQVTGMIFAVMGVSNTVSALTVARLSRRVSMKSIMMAGCFASAVAYVPMYLVGALAPLVANIALLGLLSGGMVASAMALVALAVPPEKHGTAYGIVQSASALAFGFGPLIGGSVATLLGLRSVFLVNLGAFFLAGVLVSRLLGARALTPVAPGVPAAATRAND